MFKLINLKNQKLINKIINNYYSLIYFYLLTSLSSFSISRIFSKI